MQSKIVRSAGEIPLILVAGKQIDAGKLQQLESKGAIIIDSATSDPIEMVQNALVTMGKREMTNVMLEGGAELLASFFEAQQIDEFHVYIGAKAFAGAQATGPIGGPGVKRIQDAWSLKLVGVDRFDDDLRAVYRRIEV